MTLKYKVSQPLLNIRWLSISPEVCVENIHGFLLYFSLTSVNFSYHFLLISLLSKHIFFCLPSLSGRGRYFIICWTLSVLVYLVEVFDKYILNILSSMSISLR